jgi:hypothetical protein
VVYPIVFPVDGPTYYTDTWGAARSGGRTHEGTDILAAKMTPVVAASDGVVGWVSAQCCAMELVHDDGYRSRYIHLNNDTPGTDDGLGWGFAPGIESGVRVRAGQLIGYVGDSGNAEATAPHLHFELRYPTGEAFNSYQSLLEARRPDSSNVTWHIGAISGGSMSVDTESVTTHVQDDGGTAVWGDFDGDGYSEFAVGGGASPGWVVGEVDGSVAAWSESDGADARRIHVGDFDGDGDDDLAAFLETRYWDGYRSNGSSFAKESWGRFGGRGWADQILGDFDGDGADELLSFHPATRNWWISKLSGGGWRHAIFTSYGTTSGWQIHMAADVDGDGADELLSYHPSNGTWWASDRGGSPRLVYDVRTDSGWQHLTAADVDGDGFEDLIMFHPSNGTWWVIDPDRSSVYLWGRFSTRTGWIEPMSVHLDTDAAEDLMIRHQPTGRVWAILGSTAGRLVFVGTLVAGQTEGVWLISHQDTGTGLVALTRS